MGPTWLVQASMLFSMDTSRIMDAPPARGDERIPCNLSRPKAQAFLPARRWLRRMLASFYRITTTIARTGMTSVKCGSRAARLRI